MKNIFYIAMAVFALQACKNADEKETVPGETESSTAEVVLSEKAKANAGITVGLAKLENIQIPLKVNGMVDVPPESLVSISFPFGGFLKSTDMLPGRKVSKGEVLGIMEDQSYVQLQQDFLVAQSRLGLLKSDYQRQSELREGDASSRKAFESAKAEYEMQQVVVKGLSEKLKILGIAPDGLNVDKISRSVPIRSPINGFVKAVYVNVGKFVNPSDVLFEIVDPDHIHGSLVVFEKDQHLVKTGQLLTLFNPSRPEKKYKGEVILVSRNVDSSRGITIHCHFLGEHSDLIPGMYVSAELFTNEVQFPLVPESAVVRHDGKNFVFLVNQDGKFRMREVMIGENWNGMVPLTSNDVDWASQQLVLTGAYSLLGKLNNAGEEE
ncbi:MAG: efflux RND transporter periplasmic adaptor subunit [Chitinophagaceae bacterium]|nr:efflux RND transporter periplasmic adaptor subunit [Chitinophagaceae bacterium]